MNKTNKFIDGLLLEMSIDEKIGQINQIGTSIYGGKEEHYEQMVRESKVGSFLSIKNIEKCNHLQNIAVSETRLGIPLIFAEDVVHGFQTVFPIPLAESCSWDTALMEKTAELAAKEASAAGIHWTFAPMVDASRDPRWGRIAESFGEDTFLTSIFGAAKVKGFQGDISNNRIETDRIIACAKHFAGYSESEAGRDYNTVDISWYKLSNIFLPPFKHLLDEGVLTVMSAFNALNGIPSTVNKSLLIDTLRKKMNFSGLLVSDWNALAETLAHGYCKDEQQAVSMAMNCQLDVDMSSQLYITHLKEMINKGIVAEEALDRAVYRILSLKQMLGLFENPFRSDKKTWQTSTFQHVFHRDIARKSAEESIVLLKNDDAMLPLEEDERVLFLGPFVSDKQAMLDTWSCCGKSEEIVTIKDSIINIDNYECLEEEFAWFKHRGTLTLKGKQKIQNMDKIILFLGEQAIESGEAKSKAVLSIDEIQVAFLNSVSQLNSNVIVVLMNGRPMILNKLVTKSKAVVEAWHLGSESGNAILNVLMGDVNPSGKLTVTFPKHEGQIPIYYNHFNTGRPYREDKFNTSKYIDITNEPEFSFGFGLSYTEFQIAPIKISKISIHQWLVSTSVTNIGSRGGSEVIQLYIGAQYGQYIRPVQELKDFEKVWIEPGETVQVAFTINKETLTYFDENFNKLFDNGEYLVMVGNSSKSSWDNMERIEVK
ncbi:glycoside hydrolase family 3 N-terminal domain-containing protein [Oceanobacillus neutriphilus]|uniref:beta-glucosidase n=1 Tax=Oceanobacillus neutriphilus TaxID=531815 RepID=A0ABQ2NQJ0_9BACI|nr:glycoside hydrolase family 3 N-terminal domain-containing protein [Oceanobacillus neutriphilus]GGP07840.1 beta-glucosidase [Oceanobacillus neutriphilus]